MKFSLIYKQILIMGLIATIPLFFVFLISSNSLTSFGEQIISENERVSGDVLQILSSERQTTIGLANTAIESVSLDTITLMTKLVEEKLDDDNNNGIILSENEFSTYLENAVEGLKNIKGLAVVIDDSGMTKVVVGLNGFSTNLFQKRYPNMLLSGSDIDNIISEVLMGNDDTKEFLFAGILSTVSYRPLDNGGGLIIAIPTSVFDTPTSNLERSIMLKEEDINNQLKDSLSEVKMAANESSISIKNSLVKFILLIAFFAIALAYVFAKSITKPIKMLTKAATEVSAGNPNVKIPKIKTKDEISDLADSLESSLAAVKFLMDNAESQSKKNKKKEKKNGK